jgi:DNA-directed RNA polymerase specialized sigma24 family protein
VKKGWEPTPSAFRRFLTWLDADVDSAGETYLEMRRRLVSYFARKRCVSPDELADETLSRVVRRLDEEGAITDAPARYCYIVAKFVFLEYLRRDEVHNRPATDVPAPFVAPDAGVEPRQRRLDCLDRCLEKLAADDRELILEYYQGEQRAKIEHRRRIAASAGITVNALSIRACRLRGRLETCVTDCAASKNDTFLAH